MSKTTDAHAEGLMRLIGLISTRQASRRTDELDMRQRRVIQTLGLNGDQGLNSLGQQLGLSPSTMTGLADRLERLGLAKRCDHHDRRVVLLSLTRKGKQAFKAEIEWYRYLIDESVRSLRPTAARSVHAALLGFAADPSTSRRD